MKLRNIVLVLTFAGVVACTRLQPPPEEVKPVTDVSEDPSEDAPADPSEDAPIDPSQDASTDPSRDSSADPSEDVVPGYMQTGLPVVFIDTKSGIYSREVWVEGKVSITGTSEYPSLEEMACEMKGRGNTTWSWPKKPYAIRLSEKVPVLGMKKHKRWVLLANFMDRTLQRNIVSMHVASLTNLAWTPSCVPVELVLNGKHRGTYLLIEQVRVDKNRVNIKEMSPADISGDAVTGGYLFELDFHYDNPVQWKDRGIPFSIRYPDEEDLAAEQTEYAKKYIAEASAALYGPDFADPENGYAKYLDVDSFVDYWIIYEVMGNHELGNPGSVYFHKDRGGKIVAGPPWDFDWGVLSYNTSPRAQTGLVNGSAIWYSRLFKDPAFKKKVQDRFQELLPDLEKVPEYMVLTEEMLEASAELNFAMWNPADDKSANGGRIINGDENLTYSAACARLRSNFRDRLTVIPAALERM